ncbi:hypothetical protein D3C87_1182440 [compost metagenome]
MADVDDFRGGHFRRLTGNGELLRANQLGVFTGQADGAAAMTVDQVDDVLVDLAAEDHFHHVHGRGVGDAHAVDEMALDRQALEQVTDLRAATVNHHRVDAHGLHQHDVAGEAGFQLLAFHRVAAVFDHQCLADITADVRQRFGQDLGGVGGGFAFEGHSGLRVNQNGSWRSGATRFNWTLNTSLMRCNSASSSASKRSTSTGVVLDARTRPQPLA